MTTLAWLVGLLVLPPVPRLFDRPDLAPKSDPQGRAQIYQPPAALFPHVLSRRLERDDLMHQFREQESSVLRAERNVREIRELIRRGSIGRSNLEQAEASLGIARANLKQIKARMALYEQEMAVRDGLEPGDPERGYQLLLDLVAAQIEAARYEASYRQTRHAKNEQLFDAGAFAGQRLQDSQHDLNASLARLAQLQARRAQVIIELKSYQDPEGAETAKLVRKLRLKALDSRIQSQSLIEKNARQRYQRTRRQAEDDQTTTSGVDSARSQWQLALDDLKRLKTIREQFQIQDPIPKPITPPSADENP